MSPAARRATTSRRFRPVVAPVMSSTRKRDFSRSVRRLRKCCSARISVGAMNATCRPFSIATSAANSATIVLPAPTSPCSSRFIGVARCMSSTISFNAVRCPSVSLNGRMLRADSRIRSSTWITRGFDSRTAARLRSINPSWNRKNSSKMSRTCAGVLNAFSRSAGVCAAGKCVPISAARRSGRFRRWRTSSGKGSATLSGRFDSTSKTRRRCIFGVIAPAFSYTGTMRPVWIVCAASSDSAPSPSPPMTS